MRHLHDHFFGALFGACIGVTIIFTPTIYPLVVPLFLFVVAMMAIALDFATSRHLKPQNQPVIRAIGLTAYSLLMIFFPLTLWLFHVLTDSQAFFVFFLLLFWFIGSIATFSVSMKLSQNSKQRE